MSNHIEEKTMKNYILAYHGVVKPKNKEEGARLMAEWQDWAGKLGDALVEPGNPLGPSKTVSADGVRDDGGPDPLCGYSVVKANSIDEAVAMAQNCPHLAFGTMEVAELMQMS